MKVLLVLKYTFPSLYNAPFTRSPLVGVTEVPNVSQITVAEDTEPTEVELLPFTAEIE